MFVNFINTAIANVINFAVDFMFASRKRIYTEYKSPKRIMNNNFYRINVRQLLTIRHMSAIGHELQKRICEKSIEPIVLYYVSWSKD